MSETPNQQLQTIFLQQARAKLKEARKESYNNKNNFNKWRLEFNKSLVDTLAEEEEAPCMRIIAHMNKKNITKN